MTSPILLVDPREAAYRLGVSVHTLKHWRARGVGPTYRRTPAGRIHYTPEALQSWANSLTQSRPLTAAPVSPQGTPNGKGGL